VGESTDHSPQSTGDVAEVLNLLDLESPWSMVDSPWQRLPSTFDLPFKQMSRIAGVDF